MKCARSSRCSCGAGGAMPVGCCLCRCRRNSSSQGLQESAPLGPAVPWLLCCRQFLLWMGTCSRVAEPPGAGCAGSCSFTCPGPRAEPCARSVFEDAMSSRHEAGGKCAGPWGAHQLRALGSSRGSGVLHPFPHGRVQSNPNPSGARGVSPAPPTSAAGGAEPGRCAGPSRRPFLCPCCLPAALLFADGARLLCEHRG